MCGLVAVINSAPHASKGSKAASSGSYKLNGLFNDMLLASAVRGTDGTGIFQIDGGYKVWTQKHATPSAFAVDINGMNTMIKDVSNSVITVGHVRAATQGSISDDNCHPFQGFRDNGQYIIGAHNGTLYGWDYPKNDFDVDSAWAIDKIATYGEKAFEEFYGAYAFIWYDTEQEGKVFFARNDERPLHLARTKDGKSIVLASEAGMIDWLCSKHGVEIDDIYSVDSGELMSVDTKEARLLVTAEKRLPDYYQGAGVSCINTPATNSCAIPSPPASSDWSMAKLEKVGNVKESLRRARYSVYDGSLQSDSQDMDAPPFEMGPVDADDLFIRADNDWFNDRYIDNNDRKRAMHEGVYGLMVQYEGVDFDRYTDSVVGEIAAPLKMNKALAYVTNLSPFEADEYVSNSKTMVVAGARPFGNEMEYIVVDLNEKGEEALAV